MVDYRITEQLRKKIFSCIFAYECTYVNEKTFKDKILKYKKSFLFSTCSVLIGIALFTCPVLGGLGDIYRPTDYFVYKGIHVNGDLDSLQYADGDSMYLKGKDYFIGIIFGMLVFAWQLGIYIEFDPYYYAGEGNGVTIKFKYSGPGPLHIYRL